MIFFLVLLSTSKIYPRNLKLLANKHGIQVKRTFILNDGNTTKVENVDVNDFINLTDEQQSFIDGKVDVRMSNVTGYDLVYPDGSSKWTKDIMESFLCNDVFVDYPSKIAYEDFDIGGFFVCLVVGAILSLMISATFPMIFLIKSQNNYIIKLVKFLIRDDAQAEENMKTVHEEEKKDKESENIRKMGLFSTVWMIAGSVVTFLFAVIIADMILAHYGAIHMTKKSFEGKCYSLSVDNMFYDDDKDSKLLDDDVDEDDATLERAVVNWKGANFVDFQIACDGALYQPSKNIKWKIYPDYTIEYKDVKARTVINDGILTAEGCKGGKNCRDISMPSGMNTVLTGSCTETSASIKQCFLRRKKVRTNLYFNIQNENGWRDCTMKNLPYMRLVRNGVDVSNKYKFTIITSEDSRKSWPYGWYENGAKTIVKTTDFMEGEKTAIYFGAKSNQDWMMNFRGGSDDLSYYVVKPKSALVSAYTQTCRRIVRLQLDETTEDLVEFKQYCRDVKASVNSEGRTTFTTTSKEACSIMFEVYNENDDRVEATMTISNSNPGVFFGVLCWKCTTDSSDKSVGKNCSVDSYCNDFEATLYKDLYESETVGSLTGNTQTTSRLSNEIDGSLKLGSGLSVLGKVAIALAVIAAVAGIVFLVIFLVKKYKQKKYMNQAQMQYNDKSALNL